MKARIAVLGGLALAFLGGGFAALWAGSSLVLDSGPASALADDVAAWNRRWVWLQMLTEAGGPLVGAGLIVGVGALMLVVRSRQIAALRAVASQAGSASATASRETVRS